MAPVNCKISHTSYSTFDDIDAQAAALGGWNQQYMQTSAGAFFGNVARMHWDGISLFTESLTQSVHQTGYIAPHTVALWVPLAQSTQAYFAAEAATRSICMCSQVPVGLSLERRSTTPCWA